MKTLNPQVIREKQFAWLRSMLRWTATGKAEDRQVATLGFLEAIDVQSAMLDRMLDVGDTTDDLSTLVHDLIKEREEMTSSISRITDTIRTMMGDVDDQNAHTIFGKMGEVAAALDVLARDQSGQEEETATGETVIVSLQEEVL